MVTHSHGLDVNEKQKIFREFEPGKGWAYRGINIEMMTNHIKKLYNKSFPEVLNERVFSQLGLKETAWQVNDHEYLVKVINNPNEVGSAVLGNTNDGSESNLHVSAREFAMWGNLHLNKGYFNGKQIIPTDVIKLATQVQSPDFQDQTLSKNGLFWFVQGTPSEKNEIGERVPEGSYQILGISGPTILVIPKFNIVVAKMYNKRYNYGGNNYLYYLREFSNLVADIFQE